MSNNKIAIIADVHLRFASRHEEYKTVFERIIKDIKIIAPKRICLTGDLYHIKITLSPNALSLAGWFLKELSKIAPVDIILGNHDINMQSLSQGNAISPLVELLENGFTLTKENNKLTIPKSGNGIYFYKESGFYNIDEEIVYGVYSCWDNEILTLAKKDKDPNKKYIALFHGNVYGSYLDSGIQSKGDDLIKPSVFDNFSAVFLGDIHSAQIVQEYDKELGKPLIFYPGSCIQQNYGEEITKSFSVCNIDDFSQERKYVLNDYGYTKVSVAQGEIWSDRLTDSLRFSLNPKKTKVQVELEDFEENYSVEKLSMIEHWIKSKYGCEVVSVEQKNIYREKSLTSEDKEIDINNSEDLEKLFVEFLEQNNYDNIEDVLDLSKEIDLKLNFKPLKSGLRIDFNKLEVCNLFMCPNEKTVFDFDKLNGITGIFGENFNGKSNLIKVLVWILYQKILGGGFPYRLPNMYTGSTKAYGSLYYTIGNIKYFIYRAVTVNKKKDGEYDVKYSVQYKYEKHVQSEDGTTNTVWMDVESEEKATEKGELKRMVVEALGTYEDFTKIALQGGKEDYLSLDQQSKNALIKKFLGLESFADRHELANETFKTIKVQQKVLGDPLNIQLEIDNTKLKIEEENKLVEDYTKEKSDNIEKIEKLNVSILEHTKKLHKIENLDETDKVVVGEKITTENLKLQAEKDQLTTLQEWLKLNFKKELVDNEDTFKALEEKDKAVAEAKIKVRDQHIKDEEDSIPVLEEWLKENFQKELTEETKNLKKEDLDSSLEKEQKSFASEKLKYTTADTWIKTNPKKDAKSTKDVVEEIDQLKEKLVELKNQLKLSKGEKCPTCAHISHVANPILEKECTENIVKTELGLTEKQKFIQEQKTIEDNNTTFDKKNNELDALKNTLTSKKIVIDALKVQIESCSKKDETVKHNKKVESENKRLLLIRSTIEQHKKIIEKLREQIILIDKYKIFNDAVKHNSNVDTENKKLENIKLSIEKINKEIERLDGQIVLLDKNEKLIKENIVINDAIKIIKEDIPTYMTVNLNLDKKLKDSYGNIRTYENNNENSVKKLEQIKEADRIYKKYSVYLQATGREGISANIIRSKLPIINHKINTLLKGMVDFKCEMFMKEDGDIKEMFYFNETKSDDLPISMGSQSQKFLVSVAVSDSMHDISSLIRPSIKVIDEGLDTLSNSKLMELNNLLDYLKSKYKNIFVITHKSEIKDFVDNVIDVSKTQKGMTEQQIKDNPNGGISQFLIK